MDKPTKNSNRSSCAECLTPDTTELALYNAAEGVDDVVRWCANGHVTCFRSDKQEWRTVFNFSDLGEDR